MKFNPVSKKIFTNQGDLIKKLDCPYRMNWKKMEEMDESKRLCGKCDRTIIDTEKFSDEELLAMVKNDPNTCLKIDLNQDNVRLLIK